MLSETTPVFDISAHAAACAEIHQRGITAQASRPLLDVLGEQLGLPQPLPAIFEASIDYDPEPVEQTVMPPTHLATPNRGDGVSVAFTTTSFDDEELKDRLADAMFVHPTLNPDVVAAYQNHSERAHTARNILGLGVVGVVGGIAAAPIGEAFGHHAGWANVAVSFGSVALGIWGVVKRDREISRWRSERPVRPSVDGIPSPISFT